MASHLLPFYIINKKGGLMSLIKRNRNLLPSFSRLWDEDDFFNRGLMHWGLSNFADANSTMPAVNIRETESAYEVQMAAPGMKKEDFKIELDNNMLTISSEKTEERQDDGKEKYSRREFSYESFQRSFNLPKEVVDEDKIEAHYKDGMLHLTIPKKEKAKQKPAKKIEVS
jgi:HSP20 family protein